MSWNDGGLPFLSGDSPGVLILGSYPGVFSCRVREYYANPQNRFWRIMETLFGIDRNLPYQKRTTLLLARGIALWDVISACNRKGSDDRSIGNVLQNDIGAIIQEYPSIRLIALNGSTAYRWILKQDLGDTRPVALIPLPSTSPSNTRYSYGQLLSAWQVVRQAADAEFRQ